MRGSLLAWGGGRNAADSSEPAAGQGCQRYSTPSRSSSSARRRLVGRRSERSSWAWTGNRNTLSRWRGLTAPWDELDIGCNWFNAGIVLRAAVGTRRAPKFTDAKALEPGS